MIKYSLYLKNGYLDQSSVRFLEGQKRISMMGRISTYDGRLAACDRSFFGGKWVVVMCIIRYEPCEVWELSF